MARIKVAESLRNKVDVLLERQEGTLVTHLGIEFLIIEKDRVEASMPVVQKNLQPFGLLHGGASVALAETLASVGGWLNVDETKYAVVGIEINANHIRSVRGGVVTGVAQSIHCGAKTQVWEIRITDQENELVCISRCTLAILESSLA